MSGAAKSSIIPPGLRKELPLVVLRSHPNTPNALPPDMEGRWIETNPAWPEMSVDSVLDKLFPPCRAVWTEFSEDNREHSSDMSAYVVLVTTGRRTT